MQSVQKIRQQREAMDKDLSQKVKKNHFNMLILKGKFCHLVGVII